MLCSMLDMLSACSAGAIDDTELIGSPLSLP